MRETSDCRSEKRIPVLPVVVSFALACGIYVLSGTPLIRAEVTVLSKTTETTAKKATPATGPAAVATAVDPKLLEKRQAARAAATAEALKSAARALFGRAAPVRANAKKAAAIHINGREFAQQAQPPDVRKALQSRFWDLMHRELYFMHKTCELTPDQWAKLADAAEKIIGDGSVQESWRGKTANSNNRDITLHLRVDNNIRSIQIPRETIPQIKKLLLGEARKILPADQIARLNQGVAERDEYRLRAYVSLTVALVDKKLGLSADQSDQLTARLLKEWKDRDDYSAVFANPQESDPAPYIPSHLLTGILSPSQMKSWESIQMHPSNNDYLQMYEPFNEQAFDLSRIEGSRFSRSPAIKPPPAANPNAKPLAPVLAVPTK